jgi:thiamine transport system permease protein
MARSAVQLRPGIGLGAAAAGLVAALILGTLAAVVVRAEGGLSLGPADWAAIRFTLVQATLSAILSVALAIPVARALARRRFPGRGLVITLLGAPFILPVIVAVLGLLAVFGRGGILNDGLTLLGLPKVSIYGLHGVVLAHIFFNMPLAVRLILQGWLSIPAERFRLAASLGFSPRDTRRLIERPMLWGVVPGALLVVFLICLSSFAVALTLGGGPRATTIELAVYQAFRLDFDLGRAALLATIQLGLTAAAALIALRMTQLPGFGAGLDRAVDRWDGAGTRTIDAALIATAAAFLLLPMAMVAAKGAAGLFALPPGMIAAALNSAVVAALAVVCLLALALPIALAAPRQSGRLLEATGYLGLAVSPFVLGTGLFLLTYRWIDPSSLALPVTALVNAVLALPFALRVLVPAVQEIEAGHGRLADTLGLGGWARLRWLMLPRLRAPLGFAAGLTAALSMGDLGVIALFADPETATLPLQIYRLMAAYRMEDAAAGALLLMGLSLLVFWAFDRGGRINAET